MCLGIPGKVIEIFEANGTRMGRVDFSGIQKEVCLAYVPELGSLTKGEAAAIVGLAPHAQDSGKTHSPHSARSRSRRKARAASGKLLSRS